MLLIQFNIYINHHLEIFMLNYSTSLSFAENNYICCLCTMHVHGG